MTVTELVYDPNTDITDSSRNRVEERNFNFYTERGTNLIYEATFFEDFALVRPASPAFYSHVMKVSLNDFLGTFDEYLGDRQKIRDVLDGIFDPNYGRDEPEDLELF
jgi:hypothetical protein